jgi:hypothetical protein
MLVAVYEYMHTLVAYMTETGIDRKLSPSERTSNYVPSALTLQNCTIINKCIHVYRTVLTINSGYSLKSINRLVFVAET